MTCRRSPAVVAGLLGVATLGTPAPAFAAEGLAPLDALSSIDLSSVDLTSLDVDTANALIVSFAGGVLVTIGTYALINAIARSRAAASQCDASQEGEEAAEDTEQSDVPRAAHAPRHMRPEDWERIGRLSSAEKAEEVSEAAFGSSAKGRHAARDYEDIAENYVSKQTFRQRMATRAQGVAATLSARIDANRMDGLPVIERADGSVGDVGTTWWTAAVGPSISGPINMDEAAEDAIPSEFGSAGIDDLQFMSAGPRDISRRVAPVEEDAYPEKRSVEDVTEDDWDRALKAMDEKIHGRGSAVPAPVTVAASPSPKVAAPAPLEPFSDCVGDEDSLDEPDGIEQDTQFLYFRPPAGHPEVVDTETYVDYLVAEEFSRNPSAAVRRSSRDYLRVIEGGTQTSSLRAQGRHMGSSGSDAATPDGFRPRHFAVETPVSHAEALEA